MVSQVTVSVREEVRLLFGTLSMLSAMLSAAFALNAYGQTWGPRCIFSYGLFIVLGFVSAALFVTFWRNSLRTRLAKETRMRSLFGDFQPRFHAAKRR
jgi:hypothetical protein